MGRNEQLLNQGMEFHKQGRLQEAEQCYRDLLAQDANNPELLRLIGILGYQCGNYAAAQAYLERAVSFSPANANARKALGANFLALGEIPRAIDEFQSVIRLIPNNAESFFDLGVALRAAGKLIEAENAYRQALSLSPSHFGAHNNLANLLKYQGKNDEAEKHFIAASQINPNHPEILNNLGTLDLTKGNVESAIEKFTRAHELAPALINPIKNLSETFAAIGKLDNAEICYTRAVGMAPQDAELWFGYGKVLEQLERQEQALECYRRAAAINPQMTDAILFAAKILFLKNKFNEGVDFLRSALEINSDNQDIKNNLAVCLYESGAKEEGLALLQECLQVHPDRYELHNNLGNFLRGMGSSADAVKAFERAHELDPQKTDPIYNLGVLYEQVQDYELAESFYRKALAIDPSAVNANWNLALVLLKLGKYKEGWKQYEWRWKWHGFTSPKRNFPQPLWMGENLTGKTLLVHAEQGLGDTIQFIRYVSAINVNQEKIIVEVPQALKRLANSISGLPENVYGYGEELPWFDRQVPLMSLPAAFGTELDTVPSNVPYILPEIEEAKRWENKLADCPEGLKIGIVWAGSADHSRDAYRSCALKYFEELLDIPGITFISLQKGPGVNQLAESAVRQKIIDYMDDISDFAETLGLIANLDLVISVDTSVAHLAGAAGKPVWILLAHNPDYRWLLETEDTPWYPTAKLLRQNKENDWGGVFKKVRQLLADM